MISYSLGLACPGRISQVLSQRVSMSEIHCAVCTEQPHELVSVRNQAAAAVLTMLLFTAKSCRDVLLQSTADLGVRYVLTTPLLNGCAKHARPTDVERQSHAVCFELVSGL